MKKPAACCLIAAAAAILGFLVSFQLWRTARRPPVYISVQSQTKPVGTEQPENGLLDINTATLEQLQALPGVGPVLARRILDYREAHGAFSSVSQLTLVKGIGLSLLHQILDYITVGG